ncbi:unnamed protein product [Darwinula stevensoni]|uniref:Fork-head domain-containing protein n=1 Tax=Darwinula stevensoni TaxID=69355 RepID=A0A7R8X6K4_9CRUS|nr:unnamed protein product [Darwinula stevensoni]CAG0881576.1 unnamed protein product [Darwinula stevensoni]
MHAYMPVPRTKMPTSSNRAVKSRRGKRPYEGPNGNGSSASNEDGDRELERMTLLAVESIKREMNKASNGNPPSSDLFDPAMNGYMQETGGSHFQADGNNSSSAGEFFDLVETGEPPNLSWLMNFRLDPLFPEDDQTNNNTTNNNYPLDPTRMNRNPGPICKDCGLPLEGDGAGPPGEAPPSPPPSPPAPHDQGGMVSPVTPMNPSQKPPYTYTELIAQALKENGEMTVSAIYKWIIERFPFFKTKDSRWKNSVRHNLSINPQFQKGCKSRHGHLWTLAYVGSQVGNNHQNQQGKGNEDSGEDPRFHWKKRKLGQLECQCRHRRREDNKENYAKEENRNALQASAEIILNGGVSQKVEVQFLSPIPEQQNLYHSQDFLNYVSREEVVGDGTEMYGTGSLNARMPGEHHHYYHHHHHHQHGMEVTTSTEASTSHVLAESLQIECEQVDMPLFGEDILLTNAHFPILSPS